MEMIVEQMQGNNISGQGPVPVTILKLVGSVDGSNYRQIIQKGGEIYQAGTRNLIVDLAGVTFLSSAGLVALHSLAITMRGESKSEPESGWEALGEVRKEVGQGYQDHLKLLNPQAKIRKSLDIAGFSEFLEIFDDLETALASFN